MHCYAYGGVTDPCALHNNNDVNDGLFKSPANCDRDTFYLWDEVRLTIQHCSVIDALKFLFSPIRKGKAIDGLV